MPEIKDGFSPDDHDSDSSLVSVHFGTVIAWHISYFVMKDWLSHFASRINLGFPIFLIPGLAVVLIAIITVGYRTITTARSNPIHALKYE
jgi:putative ABC transport system permease protein